MARNVESDKDELEALRKGTHKIVDDLLGKNDLYLVSRTKNKWYLPKRDASQRATIYLGRVHKDERKDGPIEADWLFAFVGKELGKGDSSFATKVLRETSGYLYPVSVEEFRQVLSALQESTPTTDPRPKMILRVCREPGEDDEIINTIPVSWYSLAMNHPEWSGDQLADTLFRLARLLRDPDAVPGTITKDVGPEFSSEQIATIEELAGRYPALRRLYCYSQQFPGEDQAETGVVFIFDDNVAPSDCGVIQLDMITRMYDRGLIGDNSGGRAQLKDTPENIAAMERVAQPVYDRDLQVSLAL